MSIDYYTLGKLAESTGGLAECEHPEEDRMYQSQDLSVNVRGGWFCKRCDKDITELMEPDPDGDY